MSVVKKTIILFFSVLAMSVAIPAHAAYEPLVRLPGLPATGSISLSMYLVGLYNFLVSIVGIVAVLMMIVGGMMYITAGGSSTAISDAKDIVANAVYGLIIAIFAWVIVAAINPDVLYIKVGSGESAVVKYRFGTFTPPNTCKCTDGYTFQTSVSADNPLPTTAAECNARCLKTGHGVAKNISCIRDGVNDLKNPAFAAFPNSGKCMCADGNDVKPKMTTPPNYDAATCDQACSTPAMVDETPQKYHCGFDYLVVKIDLDETPAACSPKCPDNAYILSPASEMWDMFLTNDGTYDIFNINTGSNPPYECAILISEERSGWWDDNCIYWVTPGSKIYNNGKSLKLDIEKSGGGPDSYNGPNGCSVVGGLANACGIDATYKGCGATTTTRIFESFYASNIVDHCGSCNISESKNSFRPAYDLVCDPTTKRWEINYAGS